MKKENQQKEAAKEKQGNPCANQKERHKEISVQVKKLNEILVGYYHYYGLTDNSRSIGLFWGGRKDAVQVAEPEEPEEKLYMGKGSGK